MIILPAFSPVSGEDTSKTRFLLIGDSLLQFGIGPALQKEIKSNPGFESVYFVQKSTGLTWKHFLDWQQKAEQLTASGKFDVIIVMLGSNDGRWLDEPGERVPWNASSKRWWRLYIQRLDRFVSTLCAETGKVYWIGMPPMKPQGYHKKTRLFNVATETMMEQKSCGRFLKTDYVSTDKPVRWSDGIHLSNQGGRLVAGQVMKQILADLNGM